LNNYREYIEKAKKRIAEAKYRDMTKKKEEKRNRLGGEICYNKNKETA
jgi:hypothetical protein